MIRHIIPRLLFLIALVPAAPHPPDHRRAANDLCSNSRPSIAWREATGDSRRVNSPWFEGDVRIAETAIFWFGRVTPTENYADVRVGYNDAHLFLHVAAFDRRLWYDTTPSLDDLTNWDAVTVYLSKNGNTGSAPDTNTYRFEAQLVWWESREAYQAAYQGDGNTWITATLPFSTTSGWRGYAPNNSLDDRGWWVQYRIPFENLDLDGPPSRDTVWGLAIALHDRDDALNTPIADKVWPETMKPQQPATWGQLNFGMQTYTPPTAIPGGTVTIRHGLEGATVLDADVGGSSACGQAAAPDYFPTWGTLNYAGKDFLNIQNQGDVADWPCFSKYYVTFPLSSIPADKAILSATLTLHLWGGAGEGWEPDPQPSLIQVFSVATDWDETTLAWNNAPWAQENISTAWVQPVDSYPGRPGIPYDWDVSRAVAEAYDQGAPLRLALYESDWAYHSGKYFDTSDVDDWGALGRPTLDITWGDRVADISKEASPDSGSQHDPIGYELSFSGTGRMLTLTDTLPIGLSAPVSLSWHGTSIPPSYDLVHHVLTWRDAPAAGQLVRIWYTANISTALRQTLVNTAELKNEMGLLSISSATVFANCPRLYLPLIQKQEADPFSLR